jgi:hypothetical protein
LPIDKSRVILTYLTAAVFKLTGKEDIQIESCQQCVITTPCNASLITEVGIIPGAFRVVKVILPRIQFNSQ